MLSTERKINAEKQRETHSESNRYATRFYPMTSFFILLNVIGTVPFLEYYSISTWFTISKTHYLKWGLNLKKHPLDLLSSSLGYSFVHCGITHLFYTAFLIGFFVIPLERKTSSREIFGVYFLSSLIVPVIIVLAFYPVQSLFWFSTQFNLFSEEYFVGASLPAWASAGSLAYYSKNEKKYWLTVGLMIILPLGYKLKISKLDRFVSDIAHVSAWLFGYCFCYIVAKYKIRLQKGTNTLLK